MSFKPPKVWAVHVKFTALEIRYVAADSRAEARAIATGMADGDLLGAADPEPQEGTMRVSRTDRVHDVPTWIKLDNTDLFYEPERD